MGGQIILVSIEADKEITDYALEWAVQNVIKPMDSLVLLAILPSHESNSFSVKTAQPRHTSKGFFSRLLKKRSAAKNNVLDKVGFVDDGRDIPQRVYNVCTQMIHHLFSLHKVVKVHTEVKVVAYTPVGSVAMIATELHARWVILDQRLNDEANCCLEQYLNSNVALIDGPFHKILRSVTFPLTMNDQEKVSMGDMLGSFPSYNQVNNTSLTVSDFTPSSINTQNASSFYSTSSSTSAGYVHQKTMPPLPKYTPSRLKQYPTSQHLSQTHGFRNKVPLRSVSGPIQNGNFMTEKDDGADTTRKVDMKTDTSTNPYAARQSVDFRQLGQKGRDQNDSGQKTLRRVSFSHEISPTIDRTSSVRRDISLARKKPAIPPPLCSICKHSAPDLGRSPRRFSHEEIESATDGFSESNFLAEGGFGKVYRGVLSDGQVVAVKQRKMVSAQGAAEFCSEVEVLSCAQHKNLVMLIGYCIEKEWLLVYEFACNGSLDRHLYGKEEGEVLTWDNRMKVACGAARALRYLHEDCRVGCIIHRDFRPNNILLTHDFKPMVGDFGLARWQADGQTEEETRVVGAFGYLAPEYTQTGLVTEKADVYAFGKVLLEILTGIKAIEFSRTTKQRYFVEWGRNFCVDSEVNIEMIDPKLGNKYDVKEVKNMMYAASLCIIPQPDNRPRMSKVLRILEGNFLPEKLDHRQEASLESYDSSRNIFPKNQERGQHQKKLIHTVTKLSSITPKLDNLQDAIFKPKTPPHMRTDKYEEYLQGSLHKHIQSFSKK
uniref:inactive protein kinase SELMODRAFT_444075-like n=1 Tax=Erigeron canadensis TaxID=72917 RepID=UPI001CB9C1E1|nr:inactive protein kinase SELMODRAFT_444075-like [Erigeron canadensis]